MSWQWLFWVLPRPHSLAARTLGRVALRISLVVLLGAIVTFYKVSDGLEAEAVDGLERYTAERRARESQVLLDGEASVAMFARQYRDAYAAQDDDEAAFDALFAQDENGAWRTRPAVFDEDATSGFIGRRVRVDAETRRALLAGYEVLSRFGPAWRTRFANAYVVTPQNAALMYWPERPWAVAGSEWGIYGKIELIRGERDTAADTPEPATPRWSRLYFDYGVNEWVVSVTRAIGDGARTVALVGHDLLLDDLIERVVRADKNGIYNLLFDQDGNLLAHPRFMPAIQASGGSLPVQRTEDVHLKAIFEAAQALAPTAAIAQLDGYDDIVSASVLNGTGWYLVTIFPKEVINRQAQGIGWLVLLVGLVALLLELSILSNTLSVHVGSPLAALVRAADRLRLGLSDAQSALAHLSPQRKDEIGTLSRAFRDMARALEKRESDLSAGNAELTRLAAELRHELRERERAESELARRRDFEALLNAVDHGVLFLDEDLNVRTSNPAYRRLWNVPEEFFDEPRTLADDMDLSRRLNLYTQSDEEWPAWRDERIRQVKAGDIPTHELVLASGRILEYQCIALPDGGRLLTYYDVTALKESAANMRIFLHGMQASMDGMALADPEGRYLWVNEAHARVYGFERDEMIGMSWTELYERAELHRFEGTIMPALGSAGTWRGEATGRRRDGTLFPQELSLSVTENGGIVCVVRDVTERKGRERALDRALAEAESSNAAKSRFLAAMSHELRTPLNAVIGFARIVHRKTEGMIPERQADNLEKIQLSGEHLLRLINEILDLSKIEAGRLEVAVAPYSPSGIVTECLRTIEPMVTRGVALVADIDAAPDVAMGDASKLRQILMNLLSNAARHTEAGRIAVSVRTRHATLVLEVSDTGPGIPDSYRTVIFEEFGQVEGPHGRPAGGTGLGLTISRRLARLMGGDLTLRSVVGRGSTFVVEVPLHMRGGSVHGDVEAVK
ncbi:ATP-binding protein [Acuticoccus sp. I52.16.1]|uniref:ATP-binding protein n=1 Tax=Acuticoccus sp. I52.16.1 TaxID=2928472 RepID=UPI001FD2768E|nr:ATP-binding protein [Acuticoccus sp. I52.16.1]UOM35744.1 ATP-binding protein [Acuticoccus sp. I52.16.1]